MSSKFAVSDSAPALPADLRAALAAAPAVEAVWRELTPIARRDFLSWIDSAKQSATRQRRIEKTCSMLAAGKRRPCCYSIVPLELHNALAALPAAKAQWHKLTPDERRDILGWIETTKPAEARMERIAQACAMLAAGKRSL